MGSPKYKKNNINVCIIEGRLIKPPQVYEKVVKFTLLTNYCGQESFVNALAFKGSMEFAKILQKGQLVLMKAKYKLNSYKGRGYPAFVVEWVYKVTDPRERVPGEESIDVGFQDEVYKEPKEDLKEDSDELLF